MSDICVANSNSNVHLHQRNIHCNLISNFTTHRNISADDADLILSFVNDTCQHQVYHTMRRYSHGSRDYNRTWYCFLVSFKRFLKPHGQTFQVLKPTYRLVMQDLFVNVLWLPVQRFMHDFYTMFD